MNILKTAFLFSLFILFVSCGSLEDNPRVKFLGPILESVGENGRLEYNGRIINNSAEEVQNVLLRYVAKNRDGKIIEAITIPIKGKNKIGILQGETVEFQFRLRSKTLSVFNKKLTLDYIE